MRFLADECCDFAVVRSLGGAGHMELALAENRILLTEDKDFAISRLQSRECERAVAQAISSQLLSLSKRCFGTRKDVLVAPESSGG